MKTKLFYSKHNTKYVNLYNEKLLVNDNLHEYWYV